MADEDQKAPAAPKKGRGVLIMSIIMVVASLGAATAGAIFGPKLIGTAPAAPVSAAPAGPAPDAPVEGSVALPPIVVDVRDSEDTIHHLKVGLAVEYAKDVTEDDLKKYLPRGREAAIAYLRSCTFDKATNPKEFDKLHKELSDRVIKAIGEERATRVVVTDFVAQ